MSDSPRHFVEAWISDNIQPTGYAPEGDISEAKTLSDVLLSSAEAEGFSITEIEDEFGNVVDYVSEAIERVNDEEVARLAAKD